MTVFARQQHRFTRAVLHDRAIGFVRAAEFGGSDYTDFGFTSGGPSRHCSSWNSSPLELRAHGSSAPLVMTSAFGFCGTAMSETVSSDTRVFVGNVLSSTDSSMVRVSGRPNKNWV